MRVAVLGIGLMGGPMAARALEAGHEAAVWNRSPSERLRDLAGRGASVAPGPADAVRGADLVVAMLADGEATLAVLADPTLRAALAPGSLVADMGSNAPDVALRLAAAIGAGFVDAPVSGGTAGAEAGTLSIFLGAAPHIADRAAAALSVFGRATRMGPVGAGQAAKLANQIVVACGIAGLAEGLAAAEAMGVEPAALAAAMRGGYADSRLLEVLGPRILAGDFAPRGRASTHLKDLRNAFASVPGAGGLAAAAAARDYLEEVLARWGDLDHAAMTLVARSRLGLAPPDDEDRP